MVKSGGLRDAFVRGSPPGPGTGRAATLDGRSGEAAPPHQAAAGRVALDGNRLVPERVGSAEKGGAGGEAAAALGRLGRGAGGGVLNGRSIGPCALYVDRCQDQ